MCLEIITLETENDKGRSAPGLLNWKLNDVFLSSSSAAAIVLPAARSDDLSLLEFLAEWSARFTKANKHLYVIAQGRKSAERPGLSRSEPALNYAASVEALKKTMSLPPDPPPYAGATVENMAVGATVSASAEYVCRTCGKSRMWLKGDTASACDNLECSDPQDGWQMTFVLF
jgi:hypothetical protein